jgi:hypothetical protein
MKDGITNLPRHIQGAIANLPADPFDAARRERIDIVQPSDDLANDQQDRRADRQSHGGDGILDCLDGALAHLPALELCLLPPLKGLLALALTLQPAIMPCPVRCERGSLMLQPALVVAEVLFRRA